MYTLHAVGYVLCDKEWNINRFSLSSPTFFSLAIFKYTGYLTIRYTAGGTQMEFIRLNTKSLYYIANNHIQFFQLLVEEG